MANYSAAEAFQRLKLVEDDIDLTSQDVGVVDELTSFVADDREDIIPEEPIIDVDAEDVNELAETYVGKVIVECNCCHSRIYKDSDEVIIDEEQGVANKDDECPVCKEYQGFTVIGQIGPFREDEFEVEVDGEEIEVEDDRVLSDDELEDEANFPDDDIDESFNTSKINESYGSTFTIVLDNVDDVDGSVWAELSDIAPDADILGDTIVAQTEDEFETIKAIFDGYGIEYEVDYQYDEALPEDVSYTNGDSIDVDDLMNTLDNLSPVNEDFQEVNVSTRDQRLSMNSDESGKISVTSEPIEDDYSDYSGDESILPLDDDIRSEIEASAEEESGEDDYEWYEEDNTDETAEGSEEMPEGDYLEEPEEEEEEEVPNESLNLNKYARNVKESYVDEEISDFDDASFDDMCESYLKKAYNNVRSFTTNSVKESNNSLFIEGVIKYKSGKSESTSFKFMNGVISKNKQVVLEGYNTKFSTGKAFSMRGKLVNKKFIPESLSYNYKTKSTNESVGGKSNKVSGRVKAKKVR